MGDVFGELIGAAYMDVFWTLVYGFIGGVLFTSVWIAVRRFALWLYHRELQHAESVPPSQDE